MHAEFEVAHTEAGIHRVLWSSSFNLAWDILAKAKLREGQKLEAEEDVAPRQEVFEARQNSRGSLALLLLPGITTWSQRTP